MRKALVALFVSSAFASPAFAQDISAAINLDLPGLQQAAAQPAPEPAFAPVQKVEATYSTPAAAAEPVYAPTPRAEPIAMAEADGERGWGGRRGGGDHGGGNEGGWQGRGGGQSAQSAPPPPPPPAPSAGNEGWRGRGGWQTQGRAPAEERSDNGMGQRGGWNRGRVESPAPVARDESWGGQGGWNRGGEAPRTAPPPPQPVQRDGGWNRGGNNSGGGRSGSWDRDNDGRTDQRWGQNRDRDHDRDRGWDRGRDNRYGQNNDWNRNRGYGNDWNHNWGHNDRNSWNRSWRNDRRYDWQDYRERNSRYYQMPRYYNPYGYDYGYRRFSVGIYLNSLFYGRNYWISDPWTYRLPDPGYGYRWVRYYDDVLLVDTRSGYVVDVIYDFFW
jgi:Ni/Co efflux regulator RcnB